MRNLIFTLVFLAFFAFKSNGQDVHFSHIYSSPTFLNPAMTGLFNGDVRIILNYKSQWQRITKGYRTMAGAVDLKMLNLGKDIIGASLQLYSDKAGDLNFSTNSANLGFSYLKSLDGHGKSFVSLGFQNAIVSNKVDYNNIIAFDNEPGVLNGAPERITYWDFSAGIAYYTTIGNENSIHIGAAIAHLNKPFISFLDRGNPRSLVIKQRKYVINAGGEIQMGKQSTLKPSLIFMDQGPHKEITMGTFWKYNTISNNARTKANSALYIGAWLRWYAEKDIAGTDAIVAAVRWDYNKLFITFSFDINISTLSKVSSGQGGPEISIVKILDSGKQGKRRTKVECPDL